jgi:DNA-directed RNA polymerase subunit RPC12/RpoP
MKIIEVLCESCEATFETLDAFPKDQIACPACGEKKLKFTETEREFKGCGGSCDSCSSCE